MLTLVASKVAGLIGWELQRTCALCSNSFRLKGELSPNDGYLC